MHRLIRLLAVVAALLLAACNSKEPLYQEQSYVFGTLVDVAVYGESEQKARQATNAVMQEFQRLHNMLHAWQPSELSKLNSAIANGKSTAVSAELAAMLVDAAQLSRQSQGLFNPAIGSLVQLWGFHADEFKAALPDEKQVLQLVAANPQMSDLSISQDSVKSTNKAVQLDLGGYAKGYALDRAAAILRRQGVNNALINIGGNVFALGQHGKRPWRVGIRHPRKTGTLATLELRDGEAIGTSGDYQRYFILNDKRYCHLIDPRNGHPASGVQAVTVLTQGAKAGVLSDVASKPLFIAGINGWRTAALQMNLSDALLVDDTGKIHVTAALKKRLEFTDKNASVEIMP